MLSYWCAKLLVTAVQVVYKIQLLDIERISRMKLLGTRRETKPGYQNLAHQRQQYAD